jgi:hypothetical protein
LCLAIVDQADLARIEWIVLWSIARGGHIDRSIEPTVDTLGNSPETAGALDRVQARDGAEFRR